MRFDICFIHNIQSIFITQFIELAVLRIVAEAHAVDIVLFHQGEVLAHQLFGNIMSCFGIMFVYVYTFQLDGLAVDEQANVWFAVFGYLIGWFDLETAETYRIRNDFACFFSVFQRYQ